jgi:hypothetical protein
MDNMTARIAHPRGPEAVMGFALLGRAGRRFPYPTAKAAARHVSLPLDMPTILRISAPNT